MILLNKMIRPHLITERYINLFKNEDKLKYIDSVWELFEKSYKSVGGFKSAVDKQDLIDNSWLWKLVKKNNKIIAAAIYKYTESGRKAVAAGSDGSEDAKNEVKKILHDDAKLGRGWGEFSGTPEMMMIKYGAVPIPSKYASKLLNKPIISYNDDGYHYTRKIAGEDKQKMILGNIDPKYLKENKT